MAARENRSPGKEQNMTAWENELDGSQCALAMKSVKRAKCVFMLLVVLMLVVQLAAMAVAYWGGVLDGDRADKWKTAITWAFQMTTFPALIAALLLSLTILFSVKLALLGRLDGLAKLLSAFYWSLILVALLLPWRHLFPPELAPGLMENLDNLPQWTQAVKPELAEESATLFDQIAYFAARAVFPVVLLLICLVVHLKFTRGRRQISEIETVETLEPAAADVEIQTPIVEQSFSEEGEQ